MAKKKKYYAVAAGKVPGIYTDWFGDRGAEMQVRGFPGAVYKGFPTQAEAEAFMKAGPAARTRRRAARSSTRTTKKPSVNKQPHDQAESGKIIVYTDGGALTNPGPGGFGVVIAAGGETREISKGYRMTTNNRMELMACIAGLKAFEKPASILLYSDSKYVINGIAKGWAEKWRANGWMRTKTDPALNADLWDQLLKLCEKHDVEFNWVKGHAGIEGNERCDELATRAASGRDLPTDRGYEKNTASGR